MSENYPSRKGIGTGLYLDPKPVQKGEQNNEATTHQAVTTQKSNSATT